MGGRAASHSGVELATIDTVDGAGGAQRLRPRRFRALLGVVPLACGVLLALGMQSSDAFATSWTPGVEPSPPANARSNPDASPLSVSCGSAGNCSAVGYYTDKSGNAQGLLLTETAGTWAPGLGATLPAGGSSLTDLIPVSCASAG